MAVTDQRTSLHTFSITYGRKIGLQFTVLVGSQPGLSFAFFYSVTVFFKDVNTTARLLHRWPPKSGRSDDEIVSCLLHAYPGRADGHSKTRLANFLRSTSFRRRVFPPTATFEAPSSRRRPPFFRNSGRKTIVKIASWMDALWESRRRAGEKVERAGERARARCTGDSCRIGALRAKQLSLFAFIVSRKFLTIRRRCDFFDDEPTTTLRFFASTHHLFFESVQNHLVPRFQEVTVSLSLRRFPEYVSQCLFKYCINLIFCSSPTLQLGKLVRLYPSTFFPACLTCTGEAWSLPPESWKVVHIGKLRPCPQSLDLTYQVPAHSYFDAIKRLRKENVLQRWHQLQFRPLAVIHFLRNCINWNWKNNWVRLMSISSFWSNYETFF